MLGEKLGDETSKTTGQRVVTVDGSPVVETSAKGSGTILGVQYHSIVTYTGTLQPDGTLAGEGRGVFMGSGGEHATFTAKGVGTFTKTGGVSWRGAFFFRSTHAKLARLNTIATLFEYEVDASGDGKGSFHEWK
jgi:hypothetical protein